MKYLNKSRLFILVLCIVMLFTSVTFAASNRVPTAPVYSANIMIDGEYLEFTDAIPENVSGRIMIPYRVIFEYLGATVDFDEETGTISGEKDGMKLAMHNGDKNIKYTAPDGTQSVIQMDVAPYIKNGRTFVPIRFISSTMGYSVGWDQDMRTVIVIDKEKIYKNLENDFSLLLATESLNPDISKTYQVNGDMTVCMHANAGDLSQDADVTMKTSGLLKGSQSLLDVNMTIESGAEKVGTTGKLRADADAGISEIQLEGITPEGQWQDAATAVVGGISGLDSVFDMAVTGNSDMTAVLDEFISVSEDDYTIDTYDQLVASYEVAKRVFGDQAFEKNGNTYTANFDSTSFASAEELSSALVDMGITGNITIKKDSNGKVSGADMNIKMYLDDPLAMFELVMTQSSRADGGSINMSLNGGGMELKIQSQATRKNTNQTFVWG